MKNPSITYRLFWTITAFVMLLNMSVLPAGLHAAGLAGFCDMDMEELGMSSMPEADHCDLAAHHESKHDDMNTDAGTEVAYCPLDFTCTCTVDKTATNTKAIPSLSKISVFFTPVILETLDISTDQEYVASTKQVFASLYSPPLFLKNSSFLN